MIESLDCKGVEKEEYTAFSCQRRNPAADRAAALKGFKEENVEGSFGAGGLNTV